MLIHTELFSNVFGLGLIHCGLGLEKEFWASSSASLFLASISASWHLASASEIGLVASNIYSAHDIN